MKETKGIKKFLNEKMMFSDLKILIFGTFIAMSVFSVRCFYLR